MIPPRSRRAGADVAPDRLAAPLSGRWCAVSWTSWTTPDRIRRTGDSVYSPSSAPRPASGAAKLGASPPVAPAFATGARHPHVPFIVLLLAALLLLPFLTSTAS